MTGERIRAAQAIRPPKGARMLRGTVSAVSPLTVQLAGGAAVAGIAVPGTTYTIGAAVLVLWQEPGVGPVYLATSTPTPAFDVTGAFAYSGTCTDWNASGWQTSVTRAGRVGTLTLAFKPGGSGIPTSGGPVGTIPAGFRPLMNLAVVAAVYVTGWTGITAHLQINRDADGGAVSVNWASSALTAGALVAAAVTYPLA